MKRTLASGLAVTILVLAICGCDGGLSTDYSKLDLATVEGTVRLDGQPVEQAFLKFESGDNTFSFAMTNQNGYYRLRFNSEKDGILPGRKTVRIRMSQSYGGYGTGPARAENAHAEGETDADDIEGKEAIAIAKELPESYNVDSQLTVDVKSGTQTVDLNLYSDGRTDGVIK